MGLMADCGISERGDGGVPHVLRGPGVDHEATLAGTKSSRHVLDVVVFLCVFGARDDVSIRLIVCSWQLPFGGAGMLGS
jgi:hypothetical protein